MLGISSEFRDQLLHLVAAFVLTAIVSAGGYVYGGASGLLFGLVRETAQHGTFKIWRLGWGSSLDLSVWTLGGILTGLIK